MEMGKTHPLVVMEPNRQPTEELMLEKGHAGEMLDIVKVWATIQGEGPHAGRPAVFIRLAGCNLACHGCDTDYTTGRYVVPVNAVIGYLHPAWPSFFVLTGGEPLRQNIGPLVSKLLDAGKEVQIETNGTLYQPLPYERRPLTIVCSPKAPAISSRLRPHITAYKYVLSSHCVNEENGLPLDILGDRNLRPAYPPPYFPKDRVYVQPFDTGMLFENIKNAHAVAASCMKFGWRAGVQLHKHLDME